jgi:hypothetical protein
MKKSFLHTTLLYMLAGLLIVSVLIRVFLPPYYFVKRAVAEESYTAHELYRTVTAVPTGSPEYLAGKVIMLKGTVTSATDDYITMGTENEVIRCTFRKTIYDRKPEVKKGDEVVLKGICLGPGLPEVLVSQCLLVKEGSPDEFSGKKGKH